MSKITEIVKDAEKIWKMRQKISAMQAKESRLSVCVRMRMNAMKRETIRAGKLSIFNVKIQRESINVALARQCIPPVLFSNLAKTTNYEYLLVNKKVGKK